MSAGAGTSQIRSARRFRVPGSHHVRRQRRKRPPLVRSPRHPFPADECGPHRRDLARGIDAEADAGPKGVERGVPECVACGRDNRLRPQRLRDAHGERVGAALMASGEGDGEASGIVDAHHPRVPRLVREQRRDQADCRSRRHEEGQPVAFAPGASDLQGAAPGIDAGVGPRCRKVRGETLTATGCGDQPDHVLTPEIRNTGLAGVRR